MSQISSKNLNDTLHLGEVVGRKLSGGEAIELIGDLGTGKTSFVRGLAKGLGSKDQVASPSFTISRIYQTPRLELHHYDLYRLQDPGVVEYELAESLSNPKAVTVIEWAGSAEGVLPKDRLSVNISISGEDSRELEFTAGAKHQHLIKDLS
jgi:tRNA threonylcarbamoyladenosine biosynthesis protein TsaE